MLKLHCGSLIRPRFDQLLSDDVVATEQSTELLLVDGARGLHLDKVDAAWKTGDKRLKLLRRGSVRTMKVEEHPMLDSHMAANSKDDWKSGDVVAEHDDVLEKGYVKEVEMKRSRPKR